MVSFPPCKINLGLNVIGKRPDGYHDLVTCFYPVPLHDILEIIPSSSFSFTSSGLTIPGASEQNLCIKAYHLLKKDFDLPAVKMHLHKIIPMGAGLGGGSSDAAWTLRLCINSFNLKLTEDRLKEYAATLGSDCPFFLYDKPMLGKGRGEVLESIHPKLKDKFLILIKPNIHVSTSEAFAGISPRPSSVDMKEIIENYSIDRWKNFLFNDFEESVFKKYPSIGELKNLLFKNGAVYASMSGSGSAVFGIFDREIDLRDKFPGSFYWSATL